MDDEYRDKLPVMPPTPRPSSEVDAVGRLLDICVQRNYPIAKYDMSNGLIRLLVFFSSVVFRFFHSNSTISNYFINMAKIVSIPLHSFKVMQASGEPHRPEFIVICQMASIKRVGKFTTKKGAKQNAALAMLEVVQSFPDVEEHQQLARVEVEPTERTFRTYCELKKSDVKHIPIRLRDRHRYLLKLPIDDRQKAYEVLMKDGISTPRDKVDLACKALKIEYEIKDVQEQPNMKMFVLLGDYDCVLIGESGALCNRVIDYFKNMLNFKIIS